MRIYPLAAKEKDRTFAFEIENAYISLTSIVGLIASVDGATDVKKRKLFAKKDDVHIEFNYMGKPYIVWEPFGDNSRYWIGPKNGPDSALDIQGLEEVFRNHRPPIYLTVIGDILTLRFIKRLVK